MKKNALAVLMVVIGLIGGTFIGWGITAVLTPGGGVQITTIEITGSTTCEPIITTASEQFMAINPNVDISVTGTGSGSGCRRPASASRPENRNPGCRGRTPASARDYGSRCRGQWNLW